jgi:hypothetical protein
MIMIAFREKISKDFLVSAPSEAFSGGFTAALPVVEPEVNPVTTILQPNKAFLVAKVR